MAVAMNDDHHNTLRHGRREGRQLRLSTLIRLRWLAVAGQTAAIAVVNLWFGFALPFAACFALISLSAWLNVGLRVAFPASRRVSANWATLLLAYDLLQLAGLLYLTGGLQKPIRHPAARPGARVGHQHAARQDVPDRRADAGGGDAAGLHPPAAAVVSRPELPGTAALSGWRVDGARVRAAVPGVLFVPCSRGGAAVVRRAGGHGAGAAARAAPVGARRSGRGRRARARHPRWRRSRWSPTNWCERCRRTDRMARTSG